MLTKTHFCFLLIFVCTTGNILSQNKSNINFGKILAEDFDVKSILIDSSTNAVVIADVGKSDFIANTTELSFSLIFTEKKRLKIINKNGFDAATVTIPLYVSDNNKSEKLDFLNAYTYNIENGKVVQTKLDKSSLFTEKHDKNWVYKKFTFPALKEGSIIEYSYGVKSDFFFNLQPWTFQGIYPVLWSQYEVGIPDFFKYVVLSQGYQPFHINKVERTHVSFSFVEHVERESSTYSTVSSGINHFNIDGALDYHTWVMKNVPALKEEAYTTTVNNADAKIEFQLNEVAFPHTTPRNYMDSWEKVANDLMLNENFGVPIERANNWLDVEVSSIVEKNATQIEKAKKIFEYIRDNFSCSDYNGIYITKNLKDIFKNKTGSGADINMLLIAMLKNQKIEATPVILSTREHGFTNEIYPLINRYNYLIVKVMIDNTAFYLDGTARQLKFGTLPLKVYNGQAREITKDLAIPVYFIADSLKELSSTYVYIANMENGEIEGSLGHIFGVYESLKLRERMAKIEKDDFKKKLQQDYPEDIKIDNLQIDSLKLLDKPVGLKFDLKLKSFANDDIVYFNPILGEAVKKNPFIAAERFYPVEMPYTIDDTYNFVMEIPKGYKVDELPKSVRFNLSEDKGMFEYIISVDKELIQMRCKVILKKANFLNEDYQFLREFYTFIVKKEAEQIVFKKVK